MDDNIKNNGSIETAAKKPGNRVKVLLIFLGVVLMVCLALFVKKYVTEIRPSKILSDKYDQACSYMQNGEYDRAIDLFQELKQYENSSSLLNECYVCRIKDSISRGEYVCVEDIYEYGDSILDGRYKLESNSILTDKQLKELNSLLSATHNLVYGDKSVINDGKPFSHEDDAYKAGFGLFGASVISYDLYYGNVSHENRPSVPFYRGISESSDLVMAVRFNGDKIDRDFEIWEAYYVAGEREYRQHLKYCFVTPANEKEYLSWESSGGNMVISMDTARDW